VFKTIRISSLLGLVLLTVACVTINVYFPTAEAVEAADQIIRGVYGEDREGGPQADDKQQPNSLLQPPAGAVPVVVGLLHWLIQPAQAAADLNIQSPGIRTLRASMEARFGQLKTFYDSGSVGMTNGGMIEVRDLNLVPLRDRKTLKTLVSDENRDRQALYKEIAVANGQPGWEPEIRKTFARRWIDNAPAGWWYQDNSGNWQRK
jgi:uncharacterized protein YdbL (DUF1318 family)